MGHEDFLALKSKKSSFLALCMDDEVCSLPTTSLKEIQPLSLSGSSMGTEVSRAKGELSEYRFSENQNIVSGTVCFPV